MTELKLHSELPKPTEIVAGKANDKFVAEAQSVMRAASIKSEPISRIDTTEKIKEPKTDEAAKLKESEKDKEKDGKDGKDGKKGPGEKTSDRREKGAADEKKISVVDTLTHRRDHSDEKEWKPLHPNNGPINVMQADGKVHELPNTSTTGSKFVIKTKDDFGHDVITSFNAKGQIYSDFHVDEKGNNVFRDYAGDGGAKTDLKVGETPTEEQLKAAKEGRFVSQMTTETPRGPERFDHLDKKGQITAHEIAFETDAFFRAYDAKNKLVKEIKY
jgi:hypothetical protein